MVNGRLSAWRKHCCLALFYALHNTFSIHDRKYRIFRTQVHISQIFQKQQSSIHR